MTAPSGWLLVVMIATTILLPFLLRPTRLSGALGLIAREAKPYLNRMWPHYWLGYLIAGVALAHAWVAMSAGGIERLNATGLYLATGALILLFGQAMLGQRLSEPTLVNRRALLRWHFRSMLGIVALALGHLVLNTPTFSLLLGR